MQVLTKLHLRVFEGGAPWASWGHDLALLRLMQVSDLYFTSYFAFWCWFCLALHLHGMVKYNGDNLWSSGMWYSVVLWSNGMWYVVVLWSSGMVYYSKDNLVHPKNPESAHSANILLQWRRCSTQSSYFHICSSHFLNVAVLYIEDHESCIALTAAWALTLYIYFNGR